MTHTSWNPFSSRQRSFGGAAAAACWVAAAVLVGTGALGAARAPRWPAQDERVKVGDVAKDFSLQSIDGQTYRLSDLRGDETAIVIFFRGTW